MAIYTGLSSLFWITSFYGCQPSVKKPEMFAISGKVTFNGNPVPRGEIFFQPDADAGNSGPASTAIIEDSKYSIDRTRGILGGAYTIRISGFEAPGGQRAVLPEEFGAPLFKEYAIKQELSKGTTELNFDVPAENGLSPQKKK